MVPLSRYVISYMMPNCMCVIYRSKLVFDLHSVCVLRKKMAWVMHITMHYYYAIPTLSSYAAPYYYRLRKHVLVHHPNIHVHNARHPKNFSAYHSHIFREIAGRHPSSKNVGVCLHRTRTTAHASFHIPLSPRPRNTPQRYLPPFRTVRGNGACV